MNRENQRERRPEKSDTGYKGKRPYNKSSRDGKSGGRYDDRRPRRDGDSGAKYTPKDGHDADKTEQKHVRKVYKKSILARIFHRNVKYLPIAKSDRAVASIFILPHSSIEQVLACISSVVAPKIVVSIMDSVSDDVKSAVKNIDGLEINRVLNADVLSAEYESHLMVAQKNKGSRMLIVSTNAVFRPYATHKMLTFLDQKDVSVVVPVFYDNTSSLVKLAKRFIGLRNLLPCSSDHHTMTESGISSYYTTHRVDYSCIDAICIWSDALSNPNKTPIFSEIEERDASIFKSLSRYGKSVFLPFARATIQENRHKSNIVAKIKFLMSYGIRL